MDSDFQVTKTDTLPKYVCTVCWQKIDDFHRFHRSVQHAQENYLKLVIKCETIECDPFIGTDAGHYEAGVAADGVEQPKHSYESDDEFGREKKRLGALENEFENNLTKFEENIESDNDMSMDIDDDEDYGKLTETEWIGANSDEARIFDKIFDEFSLLIVF